MRWAVRERLEVERRTERRSRGESRRSVSHPVLRLWASFTSLQFPKLQHFPFSQLSLTNTLESSRNRGSPPAPLPDSSRSRSSTLKKITQRSMNQQPACASRAQSSFLQITPTPPPQPPPACKHAADWSGHIPNSPRNASGGRISEPVWRPTGFFARLSVNSR